MKGFVPIICLLVQVAAIAQPFSFRDPIWASSSLRNGLVAYWQFEETSGVAYDRSSYANHLTRVNSAGSGTGKVGNGAALVRASNQHFTVPNNTTSLTFTNGTSIEIFLWCRLTALTSEHHWLVSKYSGSPPGEFELSFRVSSNAFRFNLVSNSTDYVVYSTNVATVAGVWYPVHAWYNYSTKQVGISVSNFTAVTMTGPNSLVASTSAIEVGAEDETATFGGDIDEVAIWNRDLSTDEVAQLNNTNGVTFPRFR